MFFWEFPRRLKYKSRRFGTQCRFHRPGRSGILIAQDDGTDIEFRNVGFYTSDAGEIPKGHRLHSKHGESLKTIIWLHALPFIRRQAYQ